MAVLAECLCHKKQSLRNKICSCGEDLVKRKKSNKVKYWIAYRLPGGKQRREYIGDSIEEARDADGKRRVQKREKRIFDIIPEANMTFEELAKWYLGLESVKSKKYHWVVALCLGKFNREFGNRIVFDIKFTDLENYQAKRRNEGKADSTIDQEIGAAKTMIYKAFMDKKVDSETMRVFQSVKKLLKRNSNSRKRVLSPEEFGRLLNALPYHSKGILLMAYYTGMRFGEVRSLTWDKVSLEKRLIELEAKDTKDKEPRTMPICDELYTFLKRMPRALHGNHVFLRKGKPVKDIRTGLIRACKDAGISYGRFSKGGFVLHDLRHTFNTYMRKAGVSESVIMEITGHSTREMFDRYNTIDEEDRKQAINSFEGFLRNQSASVDQNVDQVPLSDKKGISEMSANPL